jgi:hypothetical protein
MNRIASGLSPSSRPLKWIALLVLFVAGLWFVGNDVLYAIGRDRAGESELRTSVLLAHLVVATPLLFIAPLQFSRRIRQHRPKWHRRLGTAYLAFALLAALGAIHLGFTYEGAERRVPLVLFATLWVAFTIGAWVCARNHAYAAHERFVVRGYGVALAFVLVRLLGEFQEPLFAFLPEKAVRDSTREWLSFVLPLLAIESWYSWWPAMRGSRRDKKVVPDAV